MSHSAFNLRLCKEGDELPVWHGVPFTREALALFAEASGDHNPLHIDRNYAKASGFEDVFVHGMFTFAFMQHCLSGIVRQEYQKDISVRFVSIMQLGEQPVCTGKISRVEHTGQGLTCLIALSVCNPRGELKLTAEAVVTLPLV